MNSDLLIKVLFEKIVHEDRWTQYIINDDGKTVSFVGFTASGYGIEFPRSIKYKSKEYIIKNMLCSIPWFNITSIKFAPDSEVETIEKRAFEKCNVRILSIPSSLIDLKEGWCIGMDKLTNISIDKNNPKYSTFDDKFIIGKSSIEQENYDLLVFARRDIEIVEIPNFIKTIVPYALCECKKLREVKITNDSKLQSIGKFAFSESMVEKIEISSINIELSEKCFAGTINLKNVIFNPLNTQYSIYDEKFIIGKSSIEQKNFDVLISILCDVEITIIPSFIKKIAPYAIYKHQKLNTISFLGDSNLNTIGESAFYLCQNLKKVEFQTDNKLKTIENMAFYQSSIEKFSIPFNITKICEYCFNGCKRLINFEIPSNSKLQIIEEFAFSGSSIERFVIPSHLTIICKYAFYQCKNLKKIEILMNSELRKIGEFSFSDSLIESFIIPQHVVQIDKSAFSGCNKLHILELDENSELDCFKMNMFGENDREIIIMIPNKLKKLPIL